MKCLEEEDTTHLSKCQSYSKAVSVSGDGVASGLSLLYQSSADPVGVRRVLTHTTQNISRF